MKNAKSKPSLMRLLLSIFMLYLATTFLFGMVYYYVYSVDSNNFTFNSAIIQRNYQSEYSYWRTWLEEKKLPLFRGLKNDTVIHKNYIVVSRKSISIPLPFEGDTVFIKDTTQFSVNAAEIVNMAEKHYHILWNPLDFIYFSVITISTVGYGDILPNSTTVRMIVVLEIIMGQLILIVLLTYVVLNVRKFIKDK